MEVTFRRFRYFADPVCIASLVIYALNRFVLKPHHIGGWFTHGYLNDVLCLPLFVPFILHAQRLLRVRPHDGYPRVWEIMQQGVIFTIVFQLVIPRFPRTFITAGDPRDVLAYFGGGLLAAAVWRFVSMQRRRSEIAFRSGAEKTSQIPVSACTPLPKIPAPAYAFSQ